jgi:hypothetical protein
MSKRGLVAVRHRPLPCPARHFITLGLGHRHLLLERGKGHHRKHVTGQSLVFSEVDVDFDSEVLACVLQPTVAIREIEPTIFDAASVFLSTHT